MAEPHDSLVVYRVSMFRTSSSRTFYFSYHTFCSRTLYFGFLIKPGAHQFGCCQSFPMSCVSTDILIKYYMVSAVIEK